MTDSQRPYRSLFGALFAAHLTPWQARLLDDVMRLPSCRRDPAYVAAACRVPHYPYGSRPISVFYDEVGRFYRTAHRLKPMRQAYRYRMIARRRRG